MFYIFCRFVYARIAKLSDKVIVASVLAPVGLWPPYGGAHGGLHDHEHRAMTGISFTYKE
jgi:hypothetical protein